MTTAALVESESKTSDAGEGVLHHSFSAITTFGEVCSLQYRYRYIDRLPQERVSVALVFGTAVNAALLSIDQDLAKGRPPRADVAHQVLRSELEKAFGNKYVPVVSTHDEDLEGLYGKGTKMIDYYVENLLPDEVPVDMPRRFTIPLLDEKGEALPRPLVGELDRVVKLKDGRHGIIDWKTAAARWSSDRIAKDDQATAYLLAGQYVLDKKPAFFRYDLLLKTVKPAIERYYVDRTERDIKRFVKKVTVVDKAIQSGVFVPNDRSFACPTCPFKTRCENWQG
jgi:CRISPR/Cas system-associated exonuclease Cas4 (RecB family)